MNEGRRINTLSYWRSYYIYWIVLHECIETRSMKTMTLFMKKTRVSQDESQFHWYLLSWSDTSSGCKSKWSRRSLSLSLRFTIRILTDTKASWKIWDVRQISARDKRCKGEFKTICMKSLLRVENPAIRILSVHDTLEYTSMDYMDYPIWSSS